MNRLFGTDGIRGVANVDLTPELALQVGRATAAVLSGSEKRLGPVVVGRDTRVSGPMLESAIVAGLTSAGSNAVTVGIVPTPAVAAITRRTGAAAGIMISASHNPIGDNGIKIFGPDGFKLADSVEDEIEEMLSSEDLPRPGDRGVGSAKAAQNLGRHYYDQLYEHAADLTGLNVVVDGAFGAAYAVAPYALRKLGANVYEINCQDDGSRINVGCGATNPGELQSRVRELLDAGQRVVGVAFDGDADRAIFVDETGAVLNGDHILFLLARDLQKAGELRGGAVVSTVMSNIGLERALAQYGISLIRTAVGDRYVLERMREGGYVLGGEQSGHIIDLRWNTTGDGPMTAIAVLSVLARSGETLHDLTKELTVCPQVLLNVRTERKEILETPEIKRAIAQAEEDLTGSGRLLIRPSGTEPLIRVMVEGDDPDRIHALARELAGRIERAAG